MRILAGSAMPDPLSIYLNDHLAAAAGGVALVRRVANSRHGAVAEDARRLAVQVVADRDALGAIINRLGIRRTYYKEPFAIIAERVGRLKSNGTLLHRSPLSDVVEYEALALGIAAKRALWRTLRELTAKRPELGDADLEALIHRADDQLEMVERLHATAVRQAFAAQPAGNRRIGHTGAPSGSSSTPR